MQVFENSHELELTPDQILKLYDLIKHAYGSEVRSINVGHRIRLELTDGTIISCHWFLFCTIHLAKKAWGTHDVFCQVSPVHVIGENWPSWRILVNRIYNDLDKIHPIDNMHSVILTNEHTKPQ